MKAKSIKPILFLLSFVSVIFLASCKSTIEPSPVKQVNDQNLPKGYGYLLIGLDTNAYIKEISIKSWITYVYKPDSAIDEGEYLLVSLPAGNYELTQVISGLREYSLDSKLDWSFRVIEDKINYAGHLELRELFVNEGPSWFKLNWVNKLSRAQSHIDSQYMNLSDKYLMAYSGFGVDHFNQFVSSIQASLKE
ncbi:hypothetical protein [Catenovulum maritimum]|uniref:DUF2846 domain-containing protein n=1 Tax=Catenovulum maritimum TaxID=1513271 RepID=A0A0J8H0E9_9ALTE|nr:hypothetical protein [Catenovulum maritimum]KMT66949.1 hypothetical protein XM47_02300 [Catenovulum maritimum]